MVSTPSNLTCSGRPVSPHPLVLISIGCSHLVFPKSKEKVGESPHLRNKSWALHTQLTWSPSLAGHTLGLCSCFLPTIPLGFTPSTKPDPRLVQRALTKHREVIIPGLAELRDPGWLSHNCTLELSC